MDYPATKNLIKVLVIVAIVVIALLYGGRMLLTLAHHIGHGNDIKTAKVSNYSRTICDDAYESEVHAYEKQNPPYIDIKLKDGCFSGYVGIPASWTTWQTQLLGKDEGDWAAVWYSGYPDPAGPYSEQQINGDVIRFGSVPIRQVRLQGKGTLRMYRITGETRSTSSGDAALSSSQPGKPLHPLSPSSGNAIGYAMTLEQCERGGEGIACWGYARNTTDAPAELHFKDSRAVDDQGNSVFIGLAGGGVRFANDIHEKLLPGVTTKFFLKIPDPHTKVKTLTIELNTEWQKNYDHLVFKDVPVQ